MPTDDEISDILSYARLIWIENLRELLKKVKQTDDINFTYGLNGKTFLIDMSYRGNASVIKLLFDEFSPDIYKTNVN